MRMRYSCIAVIGTMLTSMAVQAQNVERVVIGDNQNFGITYTLPQTDVCATLKMVCTKTVAGSFAKYV